jgi:uncharacterized membrane protein YphA (DoxX/SURF4 family)
MQGRYAKWLAFARIYVGLLWLAYGTSKLEPAWSAPAGEFFQAAQYAAGQISGPMHDFIVSVVLPHQGLFAQLVAYGETLVGISLFFGLLKNAGASGGMFLALTYYLATGKYGSRLGVESLEGLLFVFCLLILVLPSARWFSLDALIENRAPRTRQTAGTPS